MLEFHNSLLVFVLDKFQRLFILRTIFAVALRLNDSIFSLLLTDLKCILLQYLDEHSTKVFCAFRKLII